MLAAPHADDAGACDADVAGTAECVGCAGASISHEADVGANTKGIDPDLDDGSAAIREGVAHAGSSGVGDGADARNAVGTPAGIYSGASNNCAGTGTAGASACRSPASSGLAWVGVVVCAGSTCACINVDECWCWC